MSTCVVTGGSANDTAPMACLLLNLKQTQSWVDHVVIYHDGISDKDQELMQNILPVEFIRYRFPGDESNFNEIIRYVYTPTIFCKYECLRLLERFEKVIWTDYDVLFLQDVPELLDFTPMTSGMKTMISEPEHVRSRFSDQIRWEGHQELSKLCPLDSLSIFTNLMVFSRQLDKSMELYNKCIALTERYGQWLTLPEQAVFDMATYQFGICPEAIPWNYARRPIQGQPPENDTKILHAISQPKFWNGLDNPTWNRNYGEWLKMGGSSWKPSSPFSMRSLKKSFYAIWRRFLG